jgi:cation diffusion facilitator family transporter
MIWESVIRFYRPEAIQFNEALTVTVIGLLVNLVCALVLHKGQDSHEHQNCNHSHGANKLAPAGHQHHHHGHSHGNGHTHDHNHESAYVHILTDALTSFFAIVALLLGKWHGWSWLDPAVGVVGGMVVFRWSIALIRQSGMDLLDAHDGSIDRESLVKELEIDGSRVIDLHLWRVAPGQVGCEIIIRRNQEQKSAHYRERIQKQFDIHHLIIEVV